MSNVFKYPNESGTNFINPDDSILLGALNRANTFLNGGNDNNTPYAGAYLGNGTRMSGLPDRTPEGALRHVSRFRGYYGVASGLGLDGYPTYDAIWQMPAIYCYFHVIKFGIDNAYPNPSTGTLTIETFRQHGVTHLSPIPSFTTTATHGMGNSSLKYTDTIPDRTDLLFDFSGFDTAVPGEWGNYLNGNSYYIKVIDEQKLELYTDNARTTPVNIGPSGLNWSAYTSGGFAVIATGQDGSFQLLSATFYDQSNKRYSAYDKDYYSGAGNSVNSDFGAQVVGARPGFYVSSSNTSTSSFLSNAVVDYDDYVGTWQYDSDFNPDLTIVCSGDGSPLTSVGANGCVTGVTLNPELAGLMNAGGTAASPFADYSECLVFVDTNPADTAAGYNFAVNNITQASPAVVTFTNSIVDQSANSNAANSKTFTGIVGMTELNGKFVYLKQTSHNSAELYENAACTTPVDSTGFTAYTSGGVLQDFDDNIFDQVTTFNATYLGRNVSGEYQKFAPLSLDFENVGSSDQLWPTDVSPAKMNVTIIHPTRRTYGQDLTRYTNSTGAFGYRLSLTYNNISTENWRKFDSFIKQMRGSGAPFLFNYGSPIDGNGYQLFTTSTDTVNVWNGSKPKTAKQVVAGDAAVFFTGFKPDIAPGAADSIVCKDGEVFAGLHTYRSRFTLNNVAFAGGQFETNQFGEAIIRFTAPAKDAIGVLSNVIQPFTGYGYATCMLVDDDVEFDFHPTGNFVSFKVDMDVV